MEYCSVTKRNKIGSFVEMQMDPKSATWSEVSQKEENKNGVLTHICGIQKNDTAEHISKDKQRHRYRKQTCGHRRGRCEKLGN